MMLYLGIDQHARQITISLRDENGDVCRLGRRRSMISYPGARAATALSRSVSLAGARQRKPIWLVAGYVAIAGKRFSQSTIFRIRFSMQSVRRPRLDSCWSVLAALISIFFLVVMSPRHPPAATASPRANPFATFTRA